MAELAIKGHSTRGSEVIELLEMMGGINCYNLYGDVNYACYIIENGEIKCCEYIFGDEPYVIYSLEEFEEKYPFKVGDKIERNIDYVSCFINDMRWNYDRMCVEYHLCSLYGNDAYGWHIAECFDKDCPNNTPKIMEERKYSDLRLDLYQDDKLATEATIDGDKITPPNNYLIGKITKVDNGMLVEFVKKHPQYPKTYGDCCDILGYDPCEDEINCYKSGFIESFVRILICRNAYWKIAGEELGLGKPWEPDWSTESEIKYVIEVYRDNIRKNSQYYTNTTLSFPTKKMRDAFYENFKDLIEKCKEFL